MMAFHLLGPVQLRVRGAPRDLGPPKQQAVLAALLVDAGQPVCTTTLVERVWGEQAPSEARNALYAHIMRIRRVLAAARRDSGAGWQLLRDTGGYLLDVRPEEVDLHRFRDLVNRAGAAGVADAGRAELLREAIGLWHGTAFAGLDGDWVQRVRDGCQRQRLDAMVAWARAESRLGHQDAVIAQVRTWVGEHPLVEPLAAVLIQALATVGRTAEALAHYAAIREALATELGVDPTPELLRLHQQVLRGELPQLDAPVPGPPPDPVPAAVPAQLPLDLPDFAGRAAYLNRLDALLAQADRQSTATMTVVLSGTAGVGKTALAIHWAHRVADRFPDGQLYLKLHGFEPSGSPVDPAYAVRSFLEALGVPAQRIPISAEAQAGLYRSLLAGRRVLVVLDDARDSEQVRPLLPGAAGCLVLVTSRDQLSGLVATEGARSVALGLLPANEARDLVTRRLGTRRTDAEPAAVDDIIASSARLPLALAIASARAAVAPTLPLTLLAAQLRDRQGALDAFTAGDAPSDLRTVFSWSHQTLRPRAARMFRLLGAGMGPDITAEAAASVTAEPPARAQVALAELTRANLVTEHNIGRYTFHDLLRAYARELVVSVDPAEERRAAVHRLLDHYLHTAHQADALLDPHRDPVELAAPRPGVVPEPLRDESAALAWFGRERVTVTAAIDIALREGFDRHAWQLGWTLTTFLERQGDWRCEARVQRVALEAAVRAGDVTGQAHVHRCAARAQARLGRDDVAQEHLRQALRLLEDLGDQVGMARAYLHLSWMLAQRDRNEAALEAAEQAAERFAAAGHRVGQGRALNTLGWYAIQVGRPRFALDRCQRALQLLEDGEDRHGQADTWDTIGYARHELGDPDQAVVCYRRAIELYRLTGGRHGEADTLLRLGDARQAAGELDDARTAWLAALEILVELDHPGAAQARERLDAVHSR